MLRIKILLLGIFAVSVLVNTQNIDFSTYRSGSDTVINCTHLTPFFTKLSNLEKFDSTQVLNILHIGDSHIQADFLTREIRNSLQKRFGNA
ncbi:MAG: hypothetical protein ACOYM7_12920, partial [Paludibacter sp.]